MTKYTSLPLTACLFSLLFFSANTFAKPVTISNELAIPPASEYNVVTDESVLYNNKTQEEMVFSNMSDISSAEENSRAKTNEPFQGILPAVADSSPILSKRIIGRDDRHRITNTKNYPWRTITNLKITFPDGKTSRCSGAVIDNFHVLTAGHCIYSRSHGGYASVKVYPGQNGNDTPYHYAKSTHIRTYTQWTINRNPNHDWALITLDRNIGLFTGWMGLKTSTPGSSVYRGLFNICGYPADKLNGTLWSDSDYGHSANYYRHFYFIDTYGGESGAPVWKKEGSKRYIYTIHTSGDTAQTPGISNAGTRLDTDKLYKINYWRSLDKAPKDKPDLGNDENAHSSFSPTKLSSGKSINVKHVVRNMGTAKSGTFYISYYASTDKTISKSDYYLGRKKLSAIAPFSQLHVSWNGSLPDTIPSGSYYIGWIIDSTSSINEFDESNNSGYQKSAKLTVSQTTKPSVPILISPAGNITDKTPVYTWKAVSGASYYYLWVNDSSGSKIRKWYTATAASCSHGVGNCSITPSVTLANGTGTWKVRSWGNRKYGPWSAKKTFKVSAPGSEKPKTPILLAPGGSIKTKTPTYTWKAVAGASYYYLWVNDSSGSKVRKWYTATALSCSHANETCSITPPASLANGTGTWKVRSWGNRKYGPWSAKKTFRVLPSETEKLKAPRLIAPGSSSRNRMPVYSWKAVPGASHYYLWVNDSRGARIRRSYSAASTHCYNGTGNCYIRPYTYLATGNATWKVRASNNKGNGAWSSSRKFKVLSSWWFWW